MVCRKTQLLARYERRGESHGYRAQDRGGPSDRDPRSSTSPDPCTARGRVENLRRGPEGSENPEPLIPGSTPDQDRKRADV